MVTPERWQKIEELFHSALQRMPDEHAAFLVEACAGDAELQREVGALLASLEEAGDFIEEAPLAGAISSIVEGSADEAEQRVTANRALIGRRIGHYEIQSILGAGGMGEVYLARDVMLDRPISYAVGRACGHLLLAFDLEVSSIRDHSVRVDDLNRLPTCVVPPRATQSPRCGHILLARLLELQGEERTSGSITPDEPVPYGSRVVQSYRAVEGNGGWALAVEVWRRGDQVGCQPLAK